MDKGQTEHLGDARYREESNYSRVSRGITILELPAIHMLLISRRSDRCNTLKLKYRSSWSLKLKMLPTPKLHSYSRALEA
jgi:hypothetical protein